MRRWMFLLQVFFVSYIFAAAYVGQFLVRRNRPRNGDAADRMLLLIGTAFLGIATHGTVEFISGGWGYEVAPVYSTGQAWSLTTARLVRFCTVWPPALYLVFGQVREYVEKKNGTA